MAAYMVVLDSEIADSEGLDGLAGQLAEIVGAHGGKFLIRGGPMEPQGGTLRLQRMAVAEFESVEQVTALFELEKFNELRKLRSAFVTTSVFIVDGV